MKFLFKAGILAAILLVVGCSAQKVINFDSGPYISPYGEFKVDLPAKSQKVVSGSFGNPGFFAVNFSEVPIGATKNDYSVEWTYFNNKMSSEAFYKYWDEFLPKYLSGNFGSGHYSLVRVSRSQFKETYPSIEFIANGKNNGGEDGSIYGTSIGFKNRIAVIYVIRNKQVLDIDKLDLKHEYSAYLKFVTSLECLKVCTQAVERVPIHHATAQQSQDDMEKRADSGDVGAMYDLAVLFDKGNDVVSKDDAIAAKWYLRAAERGDPRAQVVVGAWYGKGRAFPKDYMECYVWLTIAAVNSAATRDVTGDAFYYRTEYCSKEELTEEQIKIGNKKASEWKPKPSK